MLRRSNGRYQLTDDSKWIDTSPGGIQETAVPADGEPKQTNAITGKVGAAAVYEEVCRYEDAMNQAYYEWRMGLDALAHEPKPETTDLEKRKRAPQRADRRVAVATANHKGTLRRKMMNHERPRKSVRHSVGPQRMEQHSTIT